MQNCLQDIIVNRQNIVRSHDHVQFMLFGQIKPLGLNNLELINRMTDDLGKNKMKNNEKNSYSHQYTLNQFDEHNAHLTLKQSHSHQLYQKMQGYLRQGYNKKQHHQSQKLNQMHLKKTSSFIEDKIIDQHAYNQIVQKYNKKINQGYDDDDSYSPYLKLNCRNQQNQKIQRRNVSDEIEDAQKRKDQIFNRYDKNICYVVDNQKENQRMNQNDKNINQKMKENKENKEDKTQKSYHHDHRKVSSNLSSYNLKSSSKKQRIQNNYTVIENRDNNKSHKKNSAEFVRSPFKKNIDALNSTMKITPHKRKVSFVGCENSQKTLRTNNKSALQRSASKSKSKSKIYDYNQQSARKQFSKSPLKFNNTAQDYLTNRSKPKPHSKHKSIQNISQLNPGQFNFQQKLLKKIQKRIDLSIVLFQDSEMKTVKHEQNHLEMTYEKERRERQEVKNKINDHPLIVKKYDKVFYEEC